MSYIDPVIVVIVGLAVYAEYSRGLLFALLDILRIAIAVVMGVVGYTLAAGLFGSIGAGIGGLLVLSLGAALVSAVVLKRVGEGPDWNMKLPSRVAAGGVGVLLGLAICFVMLPVAGRAGPIGRAAERSVLGRLLLDRLPAVYYTADVFDLCIPQFTESSAEFSDELDGRSGVFSERINFRRLDGSTCIECGAAVRFIGYRRTGAVVVSPLFECPECGRRSDGCQTFEGFHAMYGRCPYDVSYEGFDIDCGVWPNDRAVQPTGECPVCGQGGAE